MRGGADTPGDARSVRVVGQLVFIADGDSGLQIFDVADPAHPVLRGSLDTPGSAYDVQVVGSMTYIADGANGLQAVDVSNLAKPTLAGSARVLNADNLARGVQVVGQRAYVADINLGVLIFDLSDPMHPTLLYRYALEIVYLLVAGDYIYVIQCYREIGCDYLVTRYNISDPDSALKSLGIADESSLSLAYWNGDGWVNLLPCAGCALDTQANRLTVRTNRFAEFVFSGARPAVFVPLMRR